MKKVIAFALMASGLVGFAQAKQNKEVPKVVAQAFEKEYPNTKVDWNIEKDGYEAEFKYNGKESSADYDKSGRKLETEIEIAQNEMPKNALLYLKTNYPKNKIKETAKITTLKGVISYEAELKIDGQNNDLIFDANGNFIKISKG